MRRPLEIRKYNNRKPTETPVNNGETPRKLDKDNDSRATETPVNNGETSGDPYIQ